MPKEALHYPSWFISQHPTTNMIERETDDGKNMKVLCRYL